MFSSDAIQEIRSGMKSEVTEVNGQKFHLTDKSLSKVTYTSEDSVEVYSLSQIVSFIKNYTVPEKDGLLVNVYDYNKVSVIRKNKDLNLKTVVVVSADFQGEFSPYESGQKQSQEEFIIRLQSRFVRTPELEALLALASKVTSGKTSETTDHGYSQTATLKNGVHLVSDEATVIKPIWDLNPFKSFPEIVPVTVPHILRIHSGRGDETPLFALYESDGGMWKVKTTEAIKQWLEKELTDFKQVTVL